MANAIRQWLLEYQLNKCHKRYEEKVAQLSDPYGMWIKQQEKADSETGIAIPFISLPDVWSKDLTDHLPDGWFGIVLLPGQTRNPSLRYAGIFSWDEEQNGFAKFVDDEYGLAYADEDMVDVSGRRYGAWMKPDYSPDTLLSFFYFGSIVYFNKKLVAEALEAFVPTAAPKESDQKRFHLYDFILYYVAFLKKKDKKIAHIPEVLFSAEHAGWQSENPKLPEAVNQDAYWGYEKCYASCKQNRMKDWGLDFSLRETVHNDISYHIPVYLPDGMPLISVVIPSKDNVDVLAVCIGSLVEKTDYPNYEIIVVDNGSCGQNRIRMRELQKKYSFSYLYESMPFNFSAMCNMGVAAAKGDYILLLNDDMEIIQADWMRVLLGQAMQSHVGAVGAKLLYPDTDLIQHVGITNLSVGPAHKLLKEHDSANDFYYGRNVLPYDMIGVTAACLMVSKAKYDEVGGFCEEVAVSYNDVDFCFSLHDHGYYNVIRPDVVAYHHESLSRGDDHLSDEKWDRLLHEKDHVYDRHPDLKGKDPFYSPNLAGFKHKYFCSYLYPYEQRNAFNTIKKFKKQIPDSWYNNCLTVTLEHARLERKLDLAQEKDVYWIEGWSYVLGMDSSRYERSLILKHESGAAFCVKPFDRFREDVVDILPDEQNVALAGFSCRLKREDLLPGTYTVGVLYRDTCSRQRLYKECEKQIEVV